MELIDKLEAIASEYCKENRINPEDISLIRHPESLNVIFPKNRFKEHELNRILEIESIKHRINRKVKDDFGSWEKFNDITGKSYRHKASLIKAIVSLNHILRQLNLELKLSNYEAPKQ